MIGEVDIYEESGTCVCAEVVPIVPTAMVTKSHQSGEQGVQQLFVLSICEQESCIMFGFCC